MAKFIASLWCLSMWLVESAVLDPSLYLSPSPPLTDTKNSISAAEMWTMPMDSRVARDAGDALPQLVEVGERPATKRKPQPMEKAKFFWPSFRSSHYNVGAGSVQIPLTFSLTGMYGKHSPGAMGTSGIIGSTYGTVSEIGGTVVSSLAGTGYGKYRTYSGLRIYGGENGPAWSGWGNGKWGHYGKG